MLCFFFTPILGIPGEHLNQRWDDCRESMARIQNEGYERNGFDIRVDHRSFRAQGIEREPKHRLRYNDYMREKAGERTRAGDYNREVEERNANRVQTRMPEQELSR